MKQINLAATGFKLVTKRTRKCVFLDEMSLVVPLTELVGLIQTFASAETTAKGGCPSFAVEAMLRIHFLQQWFGLSDPAMEEALHDVSLHCEFARLDRGSMRLPDETTILRFRHLLEEHKLSIKLLAIIKATLTAKGLMLKTGTVGEATLIAVPSSTKNSSGKRGPEMQQVKKGNQWHFGMKAPIGVDADSGLVHTVIGTAANVNDVTQGHSSLQHGEEQVVFADAGYPGAAKRPEATSVDWQVALRPGKRKAQKLTPWGQLVEKAEKLKASVRAKVEHPFRVIRCQFSFTKVRYKGLPKNTAQLVMLFALSHLWMARRRLLGGPGLVCPHCRRRHVGCLKRPQTWGYMPRKSVRTYLRFPPGNS